MLTRGSVTPLTFLSAPVTLPMMWLVRLNWCAFRRVVVNWNRSLHAFQNLIKRIVVRWRLAHLIMSVPTHSMISVYTTDTHTHTHTLLLIQSFPVYHITGINKRTNRQSCENAPQTHKQKKLICSIWCAVFSLVIRAPSPNNRQDLSVVSH